MDKAVTHIEGHYFTYYIDDYPYQIPNPSPGTEFLKLSECIDKRGKEWILNNIRDKGINLMNGDVVVVLFGDEWNTFVELIFDGIELIDFLYVYKDRVAILPKSFKVIQSDFPINYWDKCHNDELIYKENSFRGHEGFNSKSVVWFDHKLVKDQCLSNIKFTEDEILTTFEYNNITYTIYLDWELSNLKENCDEDDLSQFSKLLSGDDDIIFTSYSINMDMDMIDTQTSLFISLELN